MERMNEDREKLRDFNLWAMLLALLILLLLWWISFYDGNFYSKFFPNTQNQQMSEKVEPVVDAGEFIENYGKYKTNEINQNEEIVETVKEPIVVSVIQSEEVKDPIPVKKESVSVVVSYVEKGAKKALTPYEMEIKQQLYKEAIPVTIYAESEPKPKAVVVAIIPKGSVAKTAIAEESLFDENIVVEKTESVQEFLLENIEYETPFEYVADIPFLDGSEVIKDKTHMQKDVASGNNVGDLFIDVPYTLKGVYDFYMNKMGMSGWELLSYDTSGDIEMSFKKDIRIVKIYFENTGDSVIMQVNVEIKR